MTYTHLTPDELVLIESYCKNNTPVSEIANNLGRSRETIYKVVRFLKIDHTVSDYYHQYKQNKTKCGRHQTVLSETESKHIIEKVSQGWNPDVIIGRNELSISCSVRTLYRLFERGMFERKMLPMKGKRKPNGHNEKRGKQMFTRNISTRKDDHPEFDNEFGHLEGDTIVGPHHKSAIITLVERLTKVIIAIKPTGRKANDIEKSITDWFESVPKNMFKSITFDCGKEFSNWKSMSNENDIDIYFADPGTPSQRGLNENSNGLLRKDGLPKAMDFNIVNQDFVSSVASKRNNIPRKSLDYKTPLEQFMSYINVEGFCLT